MEKFDLQFKTEILLAESLSSDFNSKKYIDWAICLLQNEYKNENLYILAGLDNEDLRIIEKYFRKACSDLDVTVDIDEYKLFEKYFIHIIKQALKNRSELIGTIMKLGEIIYNTSYYENKHFDFLNLYDEVEDLTGLTLEEYSIAEFKSFLNEIEQ